MPLNYSQKLFLLLLPDLGKSKLTNSVDEKVQFLYVKSEDLSIQNHNFPISYLAGL